MNHNLPNDIRVLEVEEVDEHFNIIQSPRVKEYVYLFSSGARNHPFCAPFMVYMEESLNINLMKSAARLFEGEHDFIAFCTKPREDTQTKREILTSEIVENTLYQAKFFPRGKLPFSDPRQRISPTSGTFDHGRSFCSR